MIDIAYIALAAVGGTNPAEPATHAGARAADRAAFAGGHRYLWFPDPRLSEPAPHALAVNGTTRPVADAVETDARPRPARGPRAELAGRSLVERPEPSPGKRAG
jgi:hypothetical protein